MASDWAWFNYLDQDYLEQSCDCCECCGHTCEEIEEEDEDGEG